LADVPYSAINTCSDTTYDSEGANNIYCASNAWAGAKKACDDRNMTLPTNSQLESLAMNYLYADAYLSGGSYYGTPVSENFEMVSLNTSSLPFALWANNYYNLSGYAGNLHLKTTSFHYQGYTYAKNSTTPYVRCVK
ncbi:MAG: hypothetical protein R3Y28_02780, partial [Candidatus Gastranaerophilales bacterium]